jgi:hypothetical protein
MAMTEHHSLENSAEPTTPQGFVWVKQHALICICLWCAARHPSTRAGRQKQPGRQVQYCFVMSVWLVWLMSDMLDVLLSNVVSGLR